MSDADRVDQQPQALQAAIPILGRLQISTKLTAVFTILVSLTLIVAGISFILSAQATQRIQTTNQVRVPLALESAGAQANLLRMLANTRGYLALGDETFRQDYEVHRVAFEANLEQLQDIIVDSESAADQQTKLDQLQRDFDAWAQLPEQLFELRDNQLEREPAYKVVATDGTELAGTVLIEVQKLVRDVAQEPTVADVEILRDLADFQGTFTAMFSGLRNYVTTRNRSYRSEYIANRELNELAWSELEKKIERNQFDADQLLILATIAETRAGFLALPEADVFPVLESDAWRQDLLIFKESAVPRANNMLILLSDITTVEQAQLRTELQQGADTLARARTQTLVVGVIAIVLGGLMGVVFYTSIAGPVRRLTGVAERIRDGDIHAQAQVESRDEIGLLARTFNRMTTRLRQTLLQVQHEKKRADDLLNVVIPIGVELTSEQDFNQLLEKMLVETKNFCHADAGTLYLRTEDERLQFVIVRNDTQNLALGGTTGKEITFPPLHLYDEDGQPNWRNVAAYAALTGESLNIEEVYAPDGTLSFPGPREFDQETGYRSKSMLTIPLKNMLDEVIGVLQLINAKNPETGAIIPFDSNLQQMMLSFSSLAVAALEAYKREQALRQEIQQLRIEIDEAKLQQQVKETVETDFFQDLQERAQDIRRRRRQARSRD